MRVEVGYICERVEVGYICEWRWVIYESGGGLYMRVEVG